MSFDPYRLYTHSQKKSHKGQIIQKRAVNPHYAASEEDLKRAFIVAKSYGYSLVKGVHFLDYSIYGGVSLFTNTTRGVAFSDIYNEAVGDSLRTFNPNIFNHDPTNIRVIFILTEASLESTSGSVNVKLIDNTSFNISSYGYRLLPHSQQQLALIKLTQYSQDLINRGTVQLWNRGIIYDV